MISNEWSHTCWRKWQMRGAQSATVWLLRKYSSGLEEAFSRRTMSYVRSIISWKVRSLCWNHDPKFIDADLLHLAPETLHWHRQRKPSETLETGDHIISWPQELHFTVLQSRPMSLRNWMALASSQNRYDQKQPVRITVISQHPTSVREPRHVVTHRQSCILIGSNPNNIFHHCKEILDSTQKHKDAHTRTQYEAQEYTTQ